MENPKEKYNIVGELYLNHSLRFLRQLWQLLKLDQTILVESIMKMLARDVDRGSPSS